MNAHNRYCLHNLLMYTNWTNGSTQAQGVISHESSKTYVLAHPESISGLRALANSGRNYVEIFEDDPFFGTHWIEAVYCIKRRKQSNAEGQGDGGHSALDYAGLLAGGADTYFGVRGEAVHNKLYWVQKNGTTRWASATKSNVLYKNSYKVVGNLTSASKIASASFAGVGTVISGVQFVNNPTYANAFDAAIGLTSFIPVVGWAVSGTYFMANIGSQIITDKTLEEHIFGDTKVY